MVLVNTPLQLAVAVLLAPRLGVAPPFLGASTSRDRRRTGTPPASPCTGRLGLPIRRSSCSMETISDRIDWFLRPAPMMTPCLTLTHAVGDSKIPSARGISIPCRSVHPAGTKSSRVALWLMYAGERDCLMSLETESRRRVISSMIFFLGTPFHSLLASASCCIPTPMLVFSMVAQDVGWSQALFTPDLCYLPVLGMAGLCRGRVGCGDGYPQIAFSRIPRTPHHRLPEVCWQCARRQQRRVRSPNRAGARQDSSASRRSRKHYLARLLDRRPRQTLDNSVCRGFFLLPQ